MILFLLGGQGAFRQNATCGLKIENIVTICTDWRAFSTRAPQQTNPKQANIKKRKRVIFLPLLVLGPPENTWSSVVVVVVTAAVREIEVSIIPALAFGEI